MMAENPNRWNRRTRGGRAIRNPSPLPGKRKFNPPRTPSPQPPNFPGSDWRTYWNDVAPIGPQRDPDAPWGWGPGAPPGQEAPPPPDEEGPPPYDPPEGYEWVWDPETGEWTIEEVTDPDDVRASNDLLARINDLLSQFGLNTPGLLQLAKDAIKNGWGMNEFMQELRQHRDYLAKPLFAANIERGRQGKRVWSEGEVLNYADQVRSLAEKFGYAEPSDAFIALGFQSGKSIDEYAHHLSVQERVRTAGAGVALVYKQITGDDIDDQSLHELFDPETNTADLDRALRQAELRGRPFTLGLGIRTEAEARALEMLGVAPDEAFARYQGVAQNAPRFERLRTIEDLIAQGLPDDFGSTLGTAENGLLIRALVFQQPDALAELQAMTSREVARFRTGGGAVASQGGQQLGLLNAEERASFG